MTQLPDGVTVPKFYVLRGAEERIDEDIDLFYYEGEWHECNFPITVGENLICRPMTPEEIESATIEECCKQVCEYCGHRSGYFGIAEYDQNRGGWLHQDLRPPNWAYRCGARSIREHFYQELAG